MYETETLKEHLTAKVAHKHNIPTALVVQGGGMRGVYSMGALAYLEEVGLSRAFDLIIGSSAGAINGAYLLSGQAKDAVRVYIDYLSRRSFINFFRIRKIVNIDWLVDVALKENTPLDINSIKESSSTLQVILTNAKTGEPEVISNRDDNEFDFYEAIRATAALPGLYNKKITIHGNDYVDGGLADALPIKRAIEFGSQTSLVVVTREKNFRYKPVSKKINTIVDAALVQQTKPTARLLNFIVEYALLDQTHVIKRMVFNNNKQYIDAMEMLESRFGDYGLFGVWPSNMQKMVSRTTSNKALLEACAEMGKEDMRNALNLPYTKPAKEYTNIEFLTQYPWEWKNSLALRTSLPNSYVRFLDELNTEQFQNHIRKLYIGFKDYGEDSMYSALNNVLNNNDYNMVINIDKIMTYAKHYSALRKNAKLDIMGTRQVNVC